MKDDSNPYATPRTEAPVPAATSETGNGWRIEGDRLLVRDGAVLPEICILGGNPFLPLQGSWLRLSMMSGFSLQEVKIEVFESRHTYLKRSLILFGSLVLGFVGGSASLLSLMSDGSAAPASISVSCAVIGIGLLVAFLQCRYLPRLTKSREGWYRVEFIAPSVLARLKAIRDGRRESAA